jgi:hypothetical protein
MYPNQKIQGPFGDIYSIGTPYLDKLSDRIYAEQKQKEMQQQRDAKAVDDEFALNMAGIREADIPELTKAYGNWKMANMALIKKGNATPEEQMNVLRKKAAMYEIINPSKSFKKQEEQYGAGISKKRYDYIPDAHNNLVGIMRTPISQLKTMGDPLGSLLYKGSTYKKGAEDIKNALGIKRSALGKGRAVDAEGIQTDHDKYEFFANTPQQVKSYYLGKMADPEANWHYTNELMNLPQDELVKTNEAFNAIPAETWEKMGLKKQTLEYGKADDIADVLSTYKAQKAALENIPRLVGVERKTNKKAGVDYDFEIRKKEQHIKLANAKEILATQDYYRNKNSEELIKDVDGFIQGKVNFALKNPVDLTANEFTKDKVIIPGVEQVITPYKMTSSPSELALFETVDKEGYVYTPKSIYYDPQTKGFILKGGEENGGDRRISWADYKAVLVNKFFNNKSKIQQVRSNNTVQGDKKSEQSGGTNSWKIRATKNQ